MRIEIEIPKGFERDYETDKFRDFFGRVLSDIVDSTLCGNYEFETVEMFIKAFEESKPAYDVEAKVAELEKVSFERFGNDGMGGQKVVALDDAIEIIREPSPDLSQEMEEERE